MSERGAREALQGLGALNAAPDKQAREAGGDRSGRRKPCCGYLIDRHLYPAALDRGHQTTACWALPFFWGLLSSLPKRSRKNMKAGEAT